MTETLVEPMPAAVVIGAVSDDAPTTNGRIAAIDIARGIAMLGMLTVHIFVGNETHVTKGTLDWMLHAPSGRASVLFFTLSGVSLSLIARKNSPSATTGALVKRGAILLVVGLWLISTFWGGSILHTYGVMFLLAPLLLRRSTKTLLKVAAGAIFVGPLAALYVPFWLGSFSSGRHGVHGYIINDVLINTLFTLYAAVVWVGFFCVGMALGRCSLTSRKVAARMALGGIVVTVVMAALINPRLDESYGKYSQASFSTDAPSTVPGESGDPTTATSGDVASAPPLGADATVDPSSSTPADGEVVVDSQGAEYFMQSGERIYLDDSAYLPSAPNWHDLLATYPHSNQTPWAVMSLAIAIGILGLLLLIPVHLLRLAAPLGALGSVSLSAYLFHTMLVQDGWTWAGALDADATVLHQILALVGLQLILVTAAWLIRRRWNQGPAEWALKQLTL
jgi:uncharacterized protein